MWCFPVRLRVRGRLTHGNWPAAALLAAAAFPWPAAAQSLPPADAARHETAVLSAREGEYASALATLEQLQQQYPAERQLLYDLVTALAWAERDADAVALAEPLDPGDPPLYARLAVAKSARNLRRFELAAAWYEAALASEPANTDALAGRLLTAADAGEAERVRELIAALGTRAENEPALARAAAYARRAIGDYLPALVAYDAVLAGNPDDREALRGKALVLRSLLLPTQALELAARHPGILTPTEIERLRADEAAIRLRLITRTPYPDTSARAARQRSITLIDERLATADSASGRDALLLDRVVALSDAGQAEAAIAQFESLPPTAKRDQPYVLTAAARAYLQAEQAAAAARLLRRALELEPGHRDARFALVYALLDLDDYTAAFAEAEALTREVPMSNRIAGSAVVTGNEERLRAELLAGIADAYGDQLQAAQDRFERLLAAAPNNGELRQELANVYRWRGWLDRSLEEYRQVLTMHEDLLGAELGHAHARLDARNYRAVEMSIASARLSHPAEPAVERLAERWQVHNSSELIVTAVSGDTRGPVAGADSRSIDLRWYTAPIAYRYRGFVATHDARADFPEGEARRRRLEAGIEYRLPRFTASAEISAPRGGGSASPRGSVDWRLSDYWTVGGGIELDSDEVQLRADRLGIEADRYFATAAFTPNELAALGLGFTASDYADGNTLESLYADGRLRVLNRPRSKLDATGTLAFGRAATDDVPYFSPTRDRSLMLGLTHRFRLHRRYERELNQSVSAGLGRYAQQGFAAGRIWSLGYRIDWSLSRRHALAFEIRRLGQLYDGVTEHSTIGSVSLNSRF